jgi:hypothetical protein
LVEVREALDNNPVQKKRIDDTDWFSLR